MTLQEMIRRDLNKINEAELAEGPLRKIGMAATVAAGLMGGNAAAAQSAQPRLIQPDTIQTVQPETTQQARPAPAQQAQAEPTLKSMQNLLFRADIQRKVGTLPQFLAKAKAAGSNKSEGQLIEDWTMQCAYAAGITKQQAKEFWAAFERETDSSSAVQR